jgi:ParB-like chromosome segregation protein Spo0J
MQTVSPADLEELALDAIGDRYGRYRLCTREAELSMKRSLQRYGQISPVVVCSRLSHVELVDGFKRLAAARSLTSIETLTVRRIDVDETAAKAAMLCLNGVGGRTRELEEARIVQALVREDGLTQLQVADLVGHHKSWVCRRLALLERLCPSAQDDVALGLLSATSARAISRLPAGNQEELLDARRREALTTREVEQVAELLLSAQDRTQEEFVLANPREALAQAVDITRSTRDPRLSPTGNQVQKRLVVLLDLLPRMECWLRHRGRAELSSQDRVLLDTGFGRLAKDAGAVAEAAADFVGSPSR